MMPLAYLYIIRHSPWCCGEGFPRPIHLCTTDKRSHTRATLRFDAGVPRCTPAICPIKMRLIQRAFHQHLEHDSCPKEIRGILHSLMQQMGYKTQLLTITRHTWQETEAWKRYWPLQHSNRPSPKCHTSVFMIVTNWCWLISKSCSHRSPRRVTSRKSNATRPIAYWNNVSRKCISPSETPTKKRFRCTKINFFIRLWILTWPNRSNGKNPSEYFFPSWGCQPSIKVINRSRKDWSIHRLMNSSSY